MIISLSRSKSTAILTVSCFLFSFAAMAQPEAPDRKLSNAEQSQLEKAQLLYEEKNYRLALPMFETLLAQHPNETSIKYFTALCCQSRPDKHKLMLQYFTEVYTANKKADQVEFNLARAHYLNGHFAEAEDFLNKYITSQKKIKEQEQKEITQLTKSIQNAKALAANPLDVKILNLGEGVNTKASENSPYVTTDDSYMIFTYRGELSTGGLQNTFNETEANGLYFEDVFMSVKENDVWTKAHGITAVNSNNNDEALSISYDGQTLFISRDSQEDDGEIYMSTLVNKEWSAAVKLTGDVNTPHWEDNCILSADGKTLFFSSSRPGGYGKKDLYRSTLQTDGSWGLAQNLGDKINTAEDEDDPFFHMDGKLLLFSSKGHNSMGGYDIFKSYLEPRDSSWSKPENLGFPINTVDDDIHYVLSPSGDKGYYSISKPEGFGDNDLYSVEPGITGVMPAMLVVKGMVSIDNKPVGADISVSSNNMALKKYKANPATGFYQIVLPLGSEYKIDWQQNDTLTQTELFNTINEKGYLLKIKDINFKEKKDSISTAVSGGKLVVEGLKYKIQVSAENLHPGLDRKKIKAFGKIERSVVNKMARFTLDTEYNTLDDVNAVLDKIRTGLVPDAFVICTYEGKRYYLYELRKQGVIPEEEIKK